MKDYKLWEIVISYDAHHADCMFHIESTRLMPGVDKEHALQEARELFSAQELNGEKLLRNSSYECDGIRRDNYRERIREFHIDPQTKDVLLRSLWPN